MGITYTIETQVWLLWFLSQLICLVILLNFVIAMVSDTYDKVT